MKKKGKKNIVISINQPAYLPWLGYFHRIACSDQFVFFNTTQFEKNSFVNRNRIKTPQGALWLTVPVKLKGHIGKTIQETEIADQKWQKRHWGSLETNYKKARYWKDYAPILKNFYSRKYDTISSLSFKQLELFIKMLKIKTKIIKSSELSPSKYRKQDLVLDICRRLKANIYVSGALGRDYLKNEEFGKNKIKLFFQDYKPPVYRQLWGDFIPNLSILDILLNEGPNSLAIIFNGNIDKKGILSEAKLYE